MLTLGFDSSHSDTSCFSLPPGRYRQKRVALGQARRAWTRGPARRAVNKERVTTLRPGQEKSKQADATARQGKTNWKGTSFQQRFYIDDCKPTSCWCILIIPARCKCKPDFISSSVKKTTTKESRGKNGKGNRFIIRNMY